MVRVAVALVGAAVTLTSPAAASAQVPTAAVADLGSALVGGSLVVDAQHQHVIVEQPGDNLVRVYGYRGKLIRRLSVYRPGQMVLTTNNARLLIVTGRAGGTPKGAGVTAISTSTWSVAWRMRAPHRCLSGVAVAGGRVWATSGCAGVNRLISFDPAARSAGWARSGVGKLEGPLNLTHPTQRPHVLAGEDPGCSNCTLTTWVVHGHRARTVSAVRRRNTDHEMQFTADGTRLALAGTVAPSGNGADVVDPFHLGGGYRTYANSEYPTAVAISPTGNHLIEGNDNGLALYDSADTDAPARTWATDYVQPGDLTTTAGGHWMFDVVWDINHWDGCSCHPPHYWLEVRRIDVSNW